MEASMELWNMFSTDLVEGSDDYMTDRHNANRYAQVNMQQVKDEPQEGPDGSEKSNVGNFNATLDASSILQQNCEDDDDDDDNAIFNFDIAPKNKNNSIGNSSINYTPIVTPTRNTSYADRTPDGAPLNYDTAVIYICPACGSEYNAQDAWKRHMNYVHQYNTRQGLNFVQIDKLYHRCLQCNKNIAMHSMENLLKHKFTHLPYRCTKCRICMRQYKYRQDLMVHLRMTHRDDLMQLAKDYQPGGNNVSGSAVGHSSSNRSSINNTPKRMEIKDIKGSAHDIFDSTNDNIAVRNELIEPDDDSDIIEQPKKRTENILNSYIEDSISSHSDSRQDAENEDSIETYIQYNCPQCGTECETFGQWRQHIDFVHDFGNRKGLNFQEINMGKQTQCLECNEVLYEKTLKNMQLHKFNHLPHKNCIRCKLCYVSFQDTDMIIQHLKKQHRLEGSMPDYDNEESQSNNRTLLGVDDDDDENDDTLLSEQGTSKGDEKDIFEPHIDYICPQCGIEFFDRKQWRKHIVNTHQLADLNVLNFKPINDRQLMCNECKKVITNAYGIQNAQQHKITHMPFKAFARCRKCSKSYTDRKGLVKHLKTRHFVGEPEEINSWRGGFSSSSSSSNALFKPTLHQKQQQYQPTATSQKPQRHKQIVRHGDVAYEIVYLDDEDDALDENVSLTEAIVGDTSSAAYNSNKYNCSDCGSIFSTQKALQHHIKQEHDFLDYHNLKPVKKNNTNNVKTNNYQEESLSNDAAGDNELFLLPNGSVDDEASRSSSGGIVVSNVPSEDSSLERHFTYLCPSCGHEHKTQNEWRRHINETHNFDKRFYLNFRQIDKFRFECSQCNDIVSSSKLKGLQDHHFRHLPYKLYIKCRHCSTRYNHKPNMISHLRVRHSIVDPNVSTPEENITQQTTAATVQRPPMPLNMGSKPTRPVGLNTVEDTISYHNAVDLDFITYFCPQCNENFDSHVFWRKHIVDAHNLATRDGLNFRQLDNHHYLCLECYKRVTVTHTKGAIGQLQSHKFRHLPYRSFKCLTCNGEFVRKQMFFKHLNRATNRCHFKPASESATNSEAPSPSITAQCNDNDQNDAYDISMTIANNDATLGEALQQSTFILVCPECGEQFGTQRPWREHINIEHGLNKRDCLNITKLAPNLHQCLECGEHINGNKLRDLQIHKFKHLPHGPYLQCKFCPQAYNHIRNMQDHLQLKHPNMVQRNEDYSRMEQYEEISLLGDSDIEGIVNFDNGNANDNTNSNDDDEVIDLNNEAGDDDDDEQYLLG